jgi:hypothetical protein
VKINNFIVDGCLLFSCCLQHEITIAESEIIGVSLNFAKLP